MKLILHIGTHKTGTSAVQQFLYANRARLAEYGSSLRDTDAWLQEINVIANALIVGKRMSCERFFAKQLT